MNIPKPVLNFDICDFVSEKWQQIPNAYKYGFFIQVFLTSIIYLFDMTNDVIGNHDLVFKGKLGWFDTRTGRLLIAVPNILTGFTVFPVLRNIIAYMISAATIIILCDFLSICAKSKYKNSALVYILCGLVLTACPFYYGIHYYKFNLISYALCPFFMMCSLYISSRFSNNKYAFILSMLLITGAILTYQASIMAYAVIMLGGVLLSILSWTNTQSDVFNTLKFFLRCSLAFIFGYTLYYIMVTIYTSFLSFVFTGHTALFSWGVFFERAYLLFVYAIQHIYIAQPYMPQFLKLLAIVCILTAFLCCVMKSKILPELFFMKVFFTSMIFVLIIICTKISYLSGPGAGFHLYAYRLAVHGIALLYVLSAYICLTLPDTLFKSINIFLIILLIMVFSVNTMNAQIDAKRAYDRELLLHSRTISEIIQSVHFDGKKQYNIFVLGDIPNYRKHLIPYKFKLTSIEELEWSFASWESDVVGILRHIEPRLNVKNISDINTIDAVQLETLYELLKTAVPYPGYGYVQVKNNIILICYGDAEREKTLSEVSELLKAHK